VAIDSPGGRPLIAGNLNSPPPDLAAYPVAVAVPVQWGDQDAFGHVNNTVPLRWFETSRIACLERCGLGGYMAGRGLGPVVASISCRYRRPLAYPDLVWVGTRVGEIAHSRLILVHAVFSCAQGLIATEGQTEVVFFDFEAGRPRRVPADVREKLAACRAGGTAEPPAGATS
jgi:acyl-CoA thioester hydrolase